MTIAHRCTTLAALCLGALVGCGDQVASPPDDLAAPGGDLLTTHDAGDACTPDCTNRDCGDNGCGGVCGTCAGETECGPGYCVPKNARWLIGTLHVDEVLSGYNGHATTHYFDQTAQGTFHFTIAFAVAKEVRAPWKETDPLHDTGKQLTVTSGPAVVRFTDDGTGLLRTVAADLTGQQVTLNFINVDGVAGSTRWNYWAIKGATTSQYFQLSSPETTVARTADADGYPRLVAALVPADNYMLVRFASPPIFPPDESTDVAKGTGSLELR